MKIVATKTVGLFVLKYDDVVGIVEVPMRTAGVPPRSATPWRLEAGCRALWRSRLWKRVLCRALKERRPSDRTLTVPRLRETRDPGSGIHRGHVVRRLPPSDVQTRQTVTKLRGEEGFRKTTVTTVAVNRAEKILWEESWWDASDWNGLKELGAEKSGGDGDGKTWREHWIEKMYFDSVLHSHILHKTCIKWCRDPDREEEWEEAWEEYFVKDGRSRRWSKKWGKKGTGVWHENWGDEIDHEGNGNLWTDKWYEDVFDGGVVHWGEKWEAFLEDKCEMAKWGENWRKESDDVYHRWWRESKSRSDGLAHRSGHSTSGEHWDVREPIPETDFFPVVETGRYDIALAASSQLRAVTIEPRTR